jgi:hypothetical protein
VAQASGTTATAIQSNDVTGNNTGGAPGSTGGVLFATASTLTSFIGNKIHANGGDELAFAAAANQSTNWTIGTATCDASANSVYCYGTGNVGIRASAGATVDARGTTWASANPALNVDYSTAGGAALNASVACAANTTCP